MESTNYTQVAFLNQLDYSMIDTLHRTTFGLRTTHETVDDP